MYRELRCIYCLLSWQVFPISLSLSPLVLHRTIISPSVCAVLTARSWSASWEPLCPCSNSHVTAAATASKSSITCVIYHKHWSSSFQQEKYGLIIHFSALLIQLVFLVCPFTGETMLFFFGLSLLRLQSTHISITSNRTSGISSLQDIFVNVSKIMCFFI